MTPHLNPLLAFPAVLAASSASSSAFDPSDFLGRILPARESEASSDPGLGPYREELRSLAHESNPTLFYESLLGLASRMERENRAEAAVPLYRALSDASLASIPDAVRGRARQRWEGIVGIGAAGPRAEFLLRRLAGECSDPSILLGMGLAGAAFRMTRLAVLSRLAAGPAEALLTRGLGARVAAGLAGYAVEGLVFPAATRLGHLALGRPMEWTGQQLGRELVSSYLSLGALRLGGGFASGGVSLLGAERSLVARLLPTAGMFLGISLGHQAEVALGLRPHLDGATTLLDSLATVLQFHVAGRLAHHAFGESFAAWERGIELQSEALVGEEGSFPNLHGPTAPFSPEARLAHAVAGLSRANPLIELPVVMMSGKNDGSGSRPSFPGDLREESPSQLPSPDSEGGLEMESFAQILRHVATPEFRVQIQRENVLFRFKEAFPPTMEGRVEALLSYLNVFSASGRANIPMGRRLTIQSLASRQTLHIFKTSPAGFEARLPSVVSRSEEASRMPGTPAPRESLPVPARPKTMGATVESPRLVRGISELMEAMKGAVQAAKPGRGFQGIFILEGSELDLKALTDATQGWQSRANGTLRVLVPSLRRTFVGNVGPSGTSWLRCNGAGWGAAMGRVIFTEAVLSNAEEAYQLIEAYSRDPERQLSNESKLTIRERVGDLVAFSRFIRDSLNGLQLKGRRMSIELSAEGVRLEFEGKNGRWEARSAVTGSRPHAASVPESGKPAAPPEEKPASVEPAEPAQRGTLLKSASIPLLHRNEMEHIAAVLQRAYHDKIADEGPRVVIVETNSVKYPEGAQIKQLSSSVLDQLTKGLTSFEPGTEFQVFNVPTRQTFVGRVVGDTLRWSVGNGSEWRVASMRALRNQAIKVSNAVELYLYLQALPNKTRGHYSPEEERRFDAKEISILWEGSKPRAFQYDLNTFVIYSLTTHIPYGRNLTIGFTSGEPPIRMENYRGDLWMVERGHPDLSGGNSTGEPQE